MIRPSDIISLTDFQRRTREHVDDLKRSGRPRVLTINGRAELVVQDASAYEELLDLVDRAEAVLGIQRGLEGVAAGSGRPVAEAFESLRRELGVSASR